MSSRNPSQQNTSKQFSQHRMKQLKQVFKFVFTSGEIHKGTSASLQTKHIPEITSSAYWQKHARSPPQHPTACCEPDSADSLYTDPGAHKTETKRDAQTMTSSLSRH